MFGCAFYDDGGVVCGCVVDGIGVVVVVGVDVV